MNAKWTILAIALLLSPPVVFAQKKPSPVPTPIVLVDAIGKVAGRYAGSFALDSSLSVHMAALTINGAVTMAPISIWAEGSVRQRAWAWAPRTYAEIYFPTSNCSGPAIVNWGIPLEAYAVPRLSVVDLVGTSRILYLGANIVPSLQAVGSYRNHTPNPAAPTGYTSICVATSGWVESVPTEATVTLDTAFPMPLLLQ